jgi:hypothetical protein
MSIFASSFHKLVGRVGAVAFPFLLGAVSLARLNDGDCGREVYFDEVLEWYVDHGCVGSCADVGGGTCVPLNDVVQPNGDSWDYCCCDLGELCPVCACSVIVVNGGASVTCFQGGCPTTCAISWGPGVGNMFEVFCNCP